MGLLQVSAGSGPVPVAELLWRPVVEADDAAWLGTEPARLAGGFDLRLPPQEMTCSGYRRILRNLDTEAQGPE